MCKHTPGPWHAKPSVANRRHWNIWDETDKQGSCIATTANWLASDDINEDFQESLKTLLKGRVEA